MPGGLCSQRIIIGSAPEPQENAVLLVAATAAATVSPTSGGCWHFYDPEALLVTFFDRFPDFLVNCPTDSARRNGLKKEIAFFSRQRAWNNDG